MNYNIVETPLSMYLTVRKSQIKSAQISATPETLVEKFKKLEEANQILKTDVEEAVNESEEKSEHISQLEEKVKELLEKVDFSDRKITDLEIVNDLKEQELEISKTKTEKLVAENKSLKGENKDLSTEVNIALHEKTQSAKQFENEIEMLREKLKMKVLETEEIVKEVEIERAEVKTLKAKINIEKQSVSSQTYPMVPSR